MAKKMSKSELELMSYNDIAYMLLSEKPKKTTLDLFNKIGTMLEMTKKQIENKIGEFYTALTNDKRFIMLDDGKWDLQENHKTKQITSEEDIEEETEDYEDEEIEIEDDMFINDNNDDDISDITEEYKNLVIVDEDELEQE